jgi:proteasome accessory factor C
MTVRKGPRAAQERLRRLLVMLPWLMEQGQATVAELAERFGISEAHVITDLERASLCGLPPYVDELIDLYIEDGVVHVGVPRLFTRPLRLSAPEGFSLLTAANAALELQGADREGPLGRALAKLAATLGDPAAVTVTVDRPPLLDMVRSAQEAGRRLAITYWSAGRDELGERTIDPHLVFAERGHWYVAADDSRTGQRRTFKLDRITAAEPTGETFTPQPADVPIDGDWFREADDARTVTLVLPSDASWVADHYPVTTVTAEPDGRLRVVLPVLSERWLARLLVRVGADAEVVEPLEWRDLAARTAATLLAMYR